MGIFRFKQSAYTVLFLILIILVCFPLFRNWRQKRIIEKEINGFKQEIISKEADNKKFREMISYLESDSSLEETARLNLGMKKPGENVAVIQEEQIVSSSAMVVVKQESNYQKWFHYFFN